jgi:hypothetical protein
MGCGVEAGAHGGGQGAPGGDAQQATEVWMNRARGGGARLLAEVEDVR